LWEQWKKQKKKLSNLRQEANYGCKAKTGTGFPGKETVGY
jgi:hypothetical protein